MSETYRTDMEVTARVDVSLGHGATLTISGMGEDKELWFENAAAAWDYWERLQEDMRGKMRQAHSHMFD